MVGEVGHCNADEPTIGAGHSLKDSKTEEYAEVEASDLPRPPRRQEDLDTISSSIVG